MLKQLTCYAALSLLLVSCSGSDDNLSDLKAVGGARYGGEFRFMSPEHISSLLPCEAGDVYSQRVTCQLFDPILNLDPSGKRVIPSIAESYQVSEDARTITLKIRNGIFFHDDECFDGAGRELTAEDVKFTLDFACSGQPENQMAYLLIDRVKGAKEFNEKSKKAFPADGVPGIKATDKSTVVISLVEPCADIDKILTMTAFGVFPKEAFDHYGKDLHNHPVGTGAFMLAENTKDHLLLKRNPNYWKKDEFGNQLPFLGTINITFADKKRDELVAFRKSQIDLVLEIPADDVDEVLGTLAEAQAGKTVKHKVDALASSSIQFVGIQHQNPVLKDARVRKALSMAIDKRHLVDVDLKGDGYVAEHGVIPDAEFFQASKVKGNKFNVPAAQALLASAGYPGGAGISELKLYVNGAVDSDKDRVAKAVARDITQNLGIAVKVFNVGRSAVEKAILGGAADLWISGWIADYPDAENFLALFRGISPSMKTSAVNPFNYNNPQFDNYFTMASKELNATKRMELLVKADQLLMDDAVVIPILTEDFITMTNSRIRNFEPNSLEILNFSNIFIKELK